MKMRKVREASQVIGYNKLTTFQKKYFEETLQKFYNSFDFPEEHVPTSVKYICVGDFLRVKFSATEWLHFTYKHMWY